MMIIAAGCIILPLRTINFAILKHYLQYPFLFILLAAVGTTGYSIIASRALELLKIGVHHFSTMQAALFYIAFENLMRLFYMWFYVLMSRRERINLRIIRKHSLGYPLLAGPVVSITYTLILLAMEFASNVSYIVAFRQVSILIGVLLGIFVLKEKSTKFKIIGTIFIFTGLVWRHWRKSTFTRETISSVFLYCDGIEKAEVAGSCAHHSQKAQRPAPGYSWAASL
jgi:uncharacterized membrane protein